MGDDASKKQKSAALRDAEIAVLKANSNLSEKEIQELYDEFKELDASGTGRMNKEQFIKFYTQIAGSDNELVLVADNVFAVFDTNHDGTIDFSEFVLAEAIGNKKDPDSALELSFALLDTSGDALVSYDEIADFMEKGIKLGLTKEEAAAIDPKEIATGIYAMFGVDKAQKLNKQQFIDG
ncbi:unnamed protein product [Adineta steineri]|uniref:EF-hand domain-containing protein n=1 Tax=Adineta steineri TaxID=433720 RepID=A0A815NLI9_9BILA|nr:unnamed protein product [Adineta steineri]